MDTKLLLLANGTCLTTELTLIQNLLVDYYAGLFSGAVTDYYNWNFNEDGVTTSSTQYTTTKFTDLTIDWVNEKDRPWFLWLAHNAPHTPFHIPPSEMHSQGDLPEYTEGMDGTPYYIAAIEALDYQIVACWIVCHKMCETIQ